jgi:hypothetical protein
MKLKVRYELEAGDVILTPRNRPRYGVPVNMRRLELIVLLASDRNEVVTGLKRKKCMRTQNAMKKCVHPMK